MDLGENYLMNEEEKEEALSRFECNICLEIATEPVITKCGHLFCWPCIYQWLNQNNEFLSCPVCKNGISQKDLVPLYTKEEDKKEGQQQGEEQQNLIPPRPLPARQQPARNQNMLAPEGNFMNTMGPSMNLQNGVLLAGFGLFPSNFGLLFQQGNNIDDSGMVHQSPEIAHKHRTKQILLIIFLVGVATIFASL